MQRDETLLHINNGQQTDAIYMGYCQTGAVYTRWSGLQWTFIETGRRSDPGYESVLTLLRYATLVENNTT